MKIFAVAAGRYDDYQVLALFATREDAEAHATDINESPGYHDDAHVCEYLLHAAGARPVGRLSFTAYANIAPDGTETVDVSEKTYWPYDDAPVDTPHARDLGGYFFEGRGRAWASSYDRDTAVAAAQRKLKRLVKAKAVLA